jgi:hypothetical protein
MSVQRKIRRELTRSFRNSPRPLIEAVVEACDIPEINPESIRPYSFEYFSAAERRAIGPLIGWEIGLANRLYRHWALLLDVVTSLDEERMWKWQLWRAEVRSDTLSPVWLAVCPANEAVLMGIRRAFEHEPNNLPILVTPDAKVLDVPRRPAPRPASAMFV